MATHAVDPITRATEERQKASRRASADGPQSQPNTMTLGRRVEAGEVDTVGMTQRGQSRERRAPSTSARAGSPRAASVAIQRASIRNRGAVQHYVWNNIRRAQIQQMFLGASVIQVGQTTDGPSYCQSYSPARTSINTRKLCGTVVRFRRPGK